MTPSARAAAARARGLAAGVALALACAAEPLPMDPLRPCASSADCAQGELCASDHVCWKTPLLVPLPPEWSGELERLETPVLRLSWWVGPGTDRTQVFRVAPGRAPELAAEVEGTTIDFPGEAVPGVGYHLRAVNAQGASRPSETRLPLYGIGLRLGFDYWYSELDWVAVGVTPGAIPVACAPEVLANREGGEPRVVPSEELPSSKSGLKVTGFAPGEHWWLRARLRCGQRTYAASAPVEAWLLPGPPAALEALATPAGVYLDWSPAPAADAYEVWCGDGAWGGDPTPGTHAFCDCKDQSACQVTVTSLRGGRRGGSATRTADSRPALAPPGAVEADASLGRVDLSWPAVEGAEAYWITRRPLTSRPRLVAATAWADLLPRVWEVTEYEVRAVSRGGTSEAGVSRQVMVPAVEPAVATLGALGGLERVALDAAGQGQTVALDRTGLLRGVEVAVSSPASSPGRLGTLAVLSGTKELGRVALRPPPEAPLDSLAPVGIHGAWADLGPLGIRNGNPGFTFTFVVRAADAGQPLQVDRCADCYAGGTALQGGVAVPARDLLLKVFVQ